MSENISGRKFIIWNYSGIKKCKVLLKNLTDEEVEKALGSKEEKIALKNPHKNAAEIKQRIKTLKKKKKMLKKQIVEIEEKIHSQLSNINEEINNCLKSVNHEGFYRVLDKLEKYAMPLNKSLALKFPDVFKTLKKCRRFEQSVMMRQKAIYLYNELKIKYNKKK